MIERALVMCEGSEIGAAHLPIEKLRLRQILPAPSDLEAPATIGSHADDDRERRRIAEAMAAFGGNQTKVAATLGMARGTLIARLERYGIRRPQSSRSRAR